MVVLLPLPFASVRPWAWSLMCAFTGTLMLSWGMQVARGRERMEMLPALIRWAMVPYALALIWALLQTLPITSDPLHHPLWESMATALDIQSVGAISLDPITGRELLVRLVGYGAIFVLALQYGRDPRKARETLYAVAIAAGVYALYSLIVEFSGTNTVLWFKKTAYFNVATGPFINRNSFATYLGIGLLCATGALWQKFSDLMSVVESPAERRRVILHDLAAKAWPLLAAWISIAVALLLTESRAGVFATSIALLAFLVALGMGRRTRRRALIGFTALALLAGVSVFDLSGHGVEKRYVVQGTELANRAIFNEFTLTAVEDAPFLGVGLGTFEAVFRFYHSLGPGMRLDRAHNDLLETALELGVPAALALVISITFLGLSCAVGARTRRRDEAFPCIGFAATILVGTHAWFDFSLQMPAVAATYSLVLGAGVAQCWSSRGRRDT